ncbi:uncharacterized protein ACIBXB_021721 [Morphnus guianensis]
MEASSQLEEKLKQSSDTFIFKSLTASEKKPGNVRAVHGGRRHSVCNGAIPHFYVSVAGSLPGGAGPGGGGRSVRDQEQTAGVLPAPEGRPRHRQGQREPSEESVKAGRTGGWRAPS